MNNRSKLWAMVDRNFVESIGFFGFGIGRWIGATYEPKYRGRMPLGPERSEIFARRRWPRLTNLLGTEVASKRVHHPLARIPIIHVQRVMIQLRDLRFAKCTGSLRLRV